MLWIIPIVWISIGYYRLFLMHKEFKRYSRHFDIDAMCYVKAAIWPFFNRSIR